MTDFDFKSVKVTESALPKENRGRPSKFADNPFRSAVNDSYVMETARQITVPKSAYKTAVSYLRHAANDYKIGIRIVPSEKDAQFVALADTDMVTIVFLGQKRRKRTTKAQVAAANAAAESPADVVPTIDTETTPVPTAKPVRNAPKAK